jgi:hypothetical protein
MDIQREWPMQQRRKEESTAALNLATPDIGRMASLCNASRLMQAMRIRPDVDLTNGADET